MLVQIAGKRTVFLIKVRFAGIGHFISVQALCEYGTVVCYGGFKLCEQISIAVKQAVIIFT